MTSFDPLPLAVALMDVDSTSGAEGPVIDLAERLLGARGWRVRRIPVTPGRDDLLATAGDAPRVTFSTHLDTVPPFLPPRESAGRLYGRGACDAKGIAAAMICAGERLRTRGIPVALLFVVGEETCHDGAHAANASALRPPTAAILVNGEPTESTLAVGTKGALRLTLRTRGRAAHSAYPHLGRSATADLVRLLGELDALSLPHDPVLGATTVNIGTLSGGVADNVIAPEAEARLMARLVTSPADTLALLQRWVAGRAEVEPGVSVPPVRLGVVPGFETSVAAYATDIPALTRWGAPYLFGPGSIHVAHTDDEHVEIAELRAAVDAYERLALGALAREG
jgi:acetylornithine deacetylase